MPHLKVKPFDTDRLESLIEEESNILVRAIEIDKYRELLYLQEEESRFFLEIIKKDGYFLIKSDQITRPLNVEYIKKALRELSQKLNLDIINSNIASSPYKPPIATEYDKNIKDFEDIDKFPFDRVAIEVGFGSGRHLLYQAKQHPDRLHIGIEIHTPSAQQVLKQIQLQNIQNIWVVNYDARLLMQMLPSNICEAIFVHFPVPWDKKPHRRVISDSFVEESLRVLKPQGILELRTDSENYYRYSLEIFSNPKKVSFKVEKNREIDVVSKYEARWKREEKNIYNLTLFCEREDIALKNNYNFKFNYQFNCQKISSLPDKSIIEDDIFVHFGKKYIRSDNKGCIVECSFGSFDRPEKKYLYIEDGYVNYIPFNPINNKTSFKAHKKIEELLNV